MHTVDSRNALRHHPPMHTVPLYDYDHASRLTHYAPQTLAGFADRGILRAGVHYIVQEYRTGRLRRRVRLFTAAGIAAALARNLRRSE